MKMTKRIVALPLALVACGKTGSTSTGKSSGTSIGTSAGKSETKKTWGQETVRIAWSMTEGQEWKDQEAFIIGVTNPPEQQTAAEKRPLKHNDGNRQYMAPHEKYSDGYKDKKYTPFLSTSILSCLSNKWGAVHSLALSVFYSASPWTGEPRLHRARNPW